MKILFEINKKEFQELSMKKKEEIANIEDRSKDYQSVRSLVWNAEVGIRAIWIMYDDHSTDKNSKENVQILKDNIKYRLFATTHQYLLLIRELNLAEHRLHEMHVKDPKLLHAFPMGNPHFEQIEVELSSIFDNIIFQLSSVFDYLSHMICYISRTDKSRTVYWTKLARICRGQNNDFDGEKVRQIIDEVDRTYVGKLYDYRSRLLHNRRDKHQFTTTVGFSNEKSFDFNIKILSSKASQKHFKIIKEEIKDKAPTIIYMSSFLIKKTFEVIEKILTEIKDEIKSNSNFQNNLQNPKDKKGLMFLLKDPKTNMAKPVSDAIWAEYIAGRNKD